MEESTQPDADVSPPTNLAPTVIAQGTVDVPHRLFIPTDLTRLNAILLDGPFDQVEWKVTSPDTTISGNDPAAILAHLIWHNVTAFEVTAYKHFPTDDFLRSLKEMNHLHIWQTSQINLAWSCAAENRQPVELTANRATDFLNALPATRRFKSAFVDQIDQPSPASWWNLVARMPHSILDWLLIGIVAAIIAGLAVGIILARLL